MHAFANAYSRTRIHTYTNSCKHRRNQAKQLCSQLPLGDYMGTRNAYDEFSPKIAVNTACVGVRLGAWVLSQKSVGSCLHTT